MANYLVRARPRLERMGELQARLESGEFRGLKPFGLEMQFALEGARVDGRGCAAWESMCYCPSPLRAEREQVLDQYFDEWDIKPVPVRGKGWAELQQFPKLWDTVTPFEIPVGSASDSTVRRPRRPGLRH